jgi:3-phenylpropionate/cinnamic acid dioxygenase small subunit
MNTEGMLRLMQVQQWLYREAHLLDARRYDLWLELLDERIRYRVPSRAYIRQAHVKDFATWSVERELECDDAMALIDDDFGAIQLRVARLQSGMAWAETPPSMTRRLVSNVMILDAEADGTLSVVSTLFLAKSRGEGRVLFTAERRDRLAIRGDDFRLCERYVVLDEAVLASENLSQIF